MIRQTKNMATTETPQVNISNRLSSQHLAGRLNHNTQDQDLGSIDLVKLLINNALLIIACGLLGASSALIYCAYAQTWYESSSKVLVSVKDPRLANPGDSNWNEKTFDDDILSNHMEIIQSRSNVEKALAHSQLDQLPSIKKVIAEKDGSDAVDYVLNKLKVTKGGQGSARVARSLNIAFSHTNPEDSKQILEAIVLEYESFLDEQLNRVMKETYNLVTEAQQKVASDLVDLEQKYLNARKDVPLIYTGEGSTNVYMEKFRQIQDELVTVEIEESNVRSRLDKVKSAIAKIEQQGGTELDKLALIDTESFERLGAFAKLQLGSSASPQFMAEQPARIQEAQAQFTLMLQLKSKESELLSDFGAQHPSVIDVRKQIDLVEKFLKEKARDQKLSLLDSHLTPEILISAYLGFLENDLEAYSQRRTELEAKSEIVEAQAKQLVEFELKDRMLRDEIDRKKELFDSIVQQLQELNTASGLSGYVHEVLESPRLGQEVWPDVKLCGAGFTFVGLLIGFVLGLANTGYGEKFTSSQQIYEMTKLTILGQVMRMRSFRSRKHGRGLVDPLSPAAEKFRLLRTNLLLDVKKGTLKSLSMTSSQQQDGKSTILANLATMFADSGLKILVIDGDMRAPTLHEFYNVSIGKGLSEILELKSEPIDVIKPTGIDNLSIITAGSPVKNPAELLQSNRFDNLVQELEEDFDLILIDSGPILLVADPAIISQKTNATILVVRTSRDSRKNVLDSVSRLSSAGASIKGIVVNAYGSGKEFSGDYENYRYYYGSNRKINS